MASQQTSIPPKVSDNVGDGGNLDPIAHRSGSMNAQPISCLFEHESKSSIMSIQQLSTTPKVSDNLEIGGTLDPTACQLAKISKNPSDPINSLQVPHWCCNCDDMRYFTPVGEWQCCGNCRHRKCNKCLAMNPTA